VSKEERFELYDALARRRQAIHRWLVLLPVLFAFTLRVCRLDHHNIWGDEAFSIWLSKQPLSQVVAGGADTHPPLYPLLLYLWLPLVGDSPFATRFLSVIPGVLLVAIVYALGRRLLDRRAALLAAGLAAISPFAVYYSQETRMYAWVATFSALAVYAFLRLSPQSLTSDRDWRLETGDWRFCTWTLLFLIATLAAVYTHYYAFFVLLAMNLFVLWRWRMARSGLRRWFAMQAGLGLAYVPWVLVQTRFLERKAHTRFEMLGLAGLREVWGRTFVAFGVGTTVPPRARWLALGLLAFVLLGIVEAVRGAASIHRCTPRRWGGAAGAGDRAFLAFYLLVPLVSAWLVNPLMPFFWERYLIVALPAYLLLLAAGLCQIPNLQSLISNPQPPIPNIPCSIRKLRIAALPLALLFVLLTSAYSLYNYWYDPTYAKGGYGDLMAYVRTHAQPGDALLLENPLQRAIYDYYGPRDLPAYWFPPPYPWDDPRTQAELEAIAAHHPRLWLVMFGNPAEYDPEHALERWLSEHAFRAYHGDYVDAALALYVVGQTEPTQPVEADFDHRIRLTAYGLSSRAVTPGDTLQLALAWEALRAMERDYTVFTHLIDAQERIWAQVDSQPLGGTHPTSAWKPGEQVVDRFALQVDPEAPPGTYWIEVGWYELATMTRLPLRDGDGNAVGDRVLLGPVEVEPGS